jgi:hypothetical protein
MANSFPGTGTVQLENGIATSLCIQTTVADNNTRDAITLYENSGQASGRQSISWYNGGNDYYKARLWTEVGGGYNATTFGIDVADDARNVATRMVIRNGNVGIGVTTPVGKLDISTGGNTNVVISNDSTDTGYNIISLNGTRTKGSYAGIAGGGTGDNKLYLNSGVDVVIQTGASYTERMRITCCGAMQMSRVASDITFGDNVGGMYVRQNGNGAQNQEELRIFGRNISFVSHDGVRYMNVTSCGNLGIGTSTPTNALHIYRASGFATMALQVGGNYGYFLANGCCIGIASDAGATGIKFHINRQAPDDAMLITQAGNVGINCSAPSYKLHVNGTFYAAGSSCEYKTQICQYNTDSCMFMKLTPVTYQYKDEWCHLGKELKSETQIGLIAEDVAEVYPELAILVNEDDQKIVRNVDYEKLSIVLLSEVQKLRKELDELKTK